MPWYFSPFRVGFSAFYSYCAFVQLRWIADAEDRYRRSATWQRAVGTVIEHRIVIKRGGSSYVRYKFTVDDKQYVGDRFRSGGVYREERLTNPTLLGAGTQLVVFYNPADPNESAMTVRTDRGAESILAIGIVLSCLLAYRFVRCETVLPNMFYRFLATNRRAGGVSGMRQMRTHARQKMKYGKQSGAI